MRRQVSNLFLCPSLRYNDQSWQEVIRKILTYSEEGNRSDRKNIEGHNCTHLVNKRCSYWPTARNPCLKYSRGQQGDDLTFLSILNDKATGLQTFRTLWVEEITLSSRYKGSRLSDFCTPIWCRGRVLWQRKIFLLFFWKLLMYD